MINMSALVRMAESRQSTATARPGSAIR